MKPIIFNKEMVRAILDGRKTVTRRVVKPQPDAEIVEWRIIQHPCIDGRIAFLGIMADGREEIYIPPAQPGDILYVRENWQIAPELEGCADGGAVYMADYCDRELVHLKDKHFRWRPSIHMPKELARLFLRVTEVRAERLHEMRIADYITEGVPLYAGPVGGRAEYYEDKFAYIWDSTLKPEDLERYAYGADPWVWVIEFEVCEKPKEAL